MAAIYGATGESRQTRSLDQGPSFDFDEEYDYLPLPDVDENYIDPTDGTDDAEPSSREG